MHWGRGQGLHLTYTWHPRAPQGHQPHHVFALLCLQKFCHSLVRQHHTRGRPWTRARTPGAGRGRTWGSSVPHPHRWRSRAAIGRGPGKEKELSGKACGVQRLANKRSVGAMRVSEEPCSCGRSQGSAPPGGHRMPGTVHPRCRCCRPSTSRLHDQGGARRQV